MTKKHGRPAEEPAEHVARTYAELAVALGMDGTDPERVLSRWALKPGFPGKPAEKGRANGVLPVEQIREFMRSSGYQGAAVTDDELREARRKNELLELQLDERAMGESLGKLVDVDDIGQFMALQIGNAKAILDGAVDRILEHLPGNFGDEKRAEFRSIYEQELAASYSELSRLCGGDEEADYAGETNLTTNLAVR